MCDRLVLIRNDAQRYDPVKCVWIREHVWCRTSPFALFQVRKVLYGPPL